MRAYSFFNQSPKVELDQTNTNKALGLLQAFINTHPNSEKIKEANDLMDKCREKLETKDYKSAELYYNLGYYKAAAICFANLSEDFPDSKSGDTYKLLVIKSYFKYAEFSFEEKQVERYEKVISECADFIERFTESKYKNEVVSYKNKSNSIIKNIKNEQTKKAI
jgi:outer membrane protein assembly factor BamD